jgi:hypothetical protein
MMNQEFDIECENGIYLEPRLQEYIKKKKHYKKNNITPSLPLEKQYSITKGDIKLIKAFLNGDKSIYNYNKKDNFQDNYVQEKGFEMDPDERYRSDPRFKRYLKKVKKDKYAAKQRYNFSSIGNDYNNAFQSISPVASECDKYMMNINMDNHNEQLYSIKHRMGEIPNDIRHGFIDDIKSLDNNKYGCNKKKNIYNAKNMPFNNVTPDIDYNTRLHPMTNNEPNLLPVTHDPRIYQMMGELNSYENKLDKTYRINSDMNTENNISKQLQKKPVPFVGMGKQILNIDDKDTMCGYPGGPNATNSKAKTHGYSNPVEHYFDYISCDIQDPDHVVFQRPLPTRLDNYTQAKTYRRDIIN